MIDTQIKTIEKIRSTYNKEETSKFEQLKKLDKKVKTPALNFAYIYGSLSSLVLGTGMCFAMGVIGTTLAFAMPLGIGVGLFGIILMLTTYPIYKKILNKRKNKYSKEILNLSNNLLNNQI